MFQAFYTSFYVTLYS